MIELTVFSSSVQVVLLGFSFTAVLNASAAAWKLQWERAIMPSQYFCLARSSRLLTAVALNDTAPATNSMKMVAPMRMNTV